MALQDRTHRDMSAAEVADVLAGLIRQATREHRHYYDCIGDRRRQEELDRRVRRELPAVLDWIEALHE